MLPLQCPLLAGSRGAVALAVTPARTLVSELSRALEHICNGSASGGGHAQSELDSTDVFPAEPSRLWALLPVAVGVAALAYVGRSCWHTYLRHGSIPVGPIESEWYKDTALIACDAAHAQGSADGYRDGVAGYRPPAGSDGEGPNAGYSTEWLSPELRCVYEAAYRVSYDAARRGNETEHEST